MKSRRNIMALALSAFLALALIASLRRRGAHFAIRGR